MPHAQPRSRIGYEFMTAIESFNRYNILKQSDSNDKEARTSFRGAEVYFVNSMIIISAAVEAVIIDKRTYSIESSLVSPTAKLALDQQTPCKSLHHRPPTALVYNSSNRDPNNNNAPDDPVTTAIFSIISTDRWQ